MFELKSNPRYEELNQVIFYFLDNLKSENPNKGVLFNQLETINYKIMNYQSDNIIKNNLEFFKRIHIITRNLIQENGINEETIKTGTKLFKKLLNNINKQKKTFKKLTIATTLLAALGFGDYTLKQEMNRIDNYTQEQIELKNKIKDQVNPTQTLQEKFFKQAREQIFDKTKISEKFYNKQKQEMFYFADSFKDNYNFLEELKNEKLYNKETRTLTLSNVNQKLKNELNKLALEQNINPKIVFFIAVVESRFGKNLLSKSGALGVLQTMPETMKENCREYYREYVNDKGIEKGEEAFYKDFYVRLKTGIRELKKSQIAYSINMKPNSTPSAYDYMMIGANYNKGIGYFKRTPQYINNKNREVHGYITKLLTLLFNVDKIE